MNYPRFRSALANFGVFDVKDIRAADPVFDRRRLTEWQAKGHIRKIAKGVYILADVKVDEALMVRIANKLYPPSYVSLESALASYQLIPEASYGMTSVTTRRTYRFSTPLATFSYRTVAPHLFFGYTVLPDAAKLATVEKALLDFFYLNPDVDGPDAYASLRIDHQALLQQIDRTILIEQLRRFGSKALDRRVERFMEWMLHA